MVNHIAPSAPVVIADGNAPVTGSGNSLTSPEVVMRPMRSAAVSVNHNAPSGPVAIPNGPDFGVGTANSVTSPSVVIRPMRWAWYSVNHNAPSGPFVMMVGPLSGSSRWFSGSLPGTSRPICPLCTSVYQSAPSGPVTIAYGPPPGTGYSSMRTCVMSAPVRVGGDADNVTAAMVRAPLSPAVLR